MTDYILSFKPAVGMFGVHDPSTAIFEGPELVYSIEEERLIREKHAMSKFPVNSIKSCLDYCDVSLQDLEKIILPYDPKLRKNNIKHDLSKAISSNSYLERIYDTEEYAKNLAISQVRPNIRVRKELKKEFGEPLPPIENKEHHACHAASAFYPSGFEQALVLSIDGKGEYDSTVIWRGSPNGIQRIKTYKSPNSLGHFFGVITKYLGYRPYNGEGKVMGLAPYGERNKEIEATLRRLIDTGVEYDVTKLTFDGLEAGVQKLETVFNRPRNDRPGEFDKWQKDLAYVSQFLLEEIVSNIVDRYIQQFNVNNIALSGGVALNCKLNKKIMEMDAVENIFIQPVSNDGGLAIGAGMLSYTPAQISDDFDIYLGPEYDSGDIKTTLEKNKINYTEPNNLERRVAKEIADGKLVGWFNGRLEMGPRALGNRSILADPRSEESRDRVNKFVKHREEWRPFAPSMHEEAAEEYLIDAEPSPYMIKTFSVKEEKIDDLSAVVHPADGTTRPQTVNSQQNPRYHKLIDEFESQTGVPVVLNTSFNDHGEPIVNKPVEAIKDFYGMGLDILVLNDFLLEK